MSRLIRTCGPVAPTPSIASGQTKSGAIEISGAAFVTIKTPAALTGTTISFEGCESLGGTYVPIYDEFNTLVSLTVTTSRGYPVPSPVMAWPYIKIVSGSSEGADRSIVVLLKS